MGLIGRNNTLFLLKVVMICLRVFLTFKFWFKQNGPIQLLSQQLDGDILLCFHFFPPSLLILICSQLLTFLPGFVIFSEDRYGFLTLGRTPRPPVLSPVTENFPSPCPSNQCSQRPPSHLQGHRNQRLPRISHCHCHRSLLDQ